MPGSSSLSSHLQNVSVLNAAPASMGYVADIDFLLNYRSLTFARSPVEAAAVDPRVGGAFYDLVTPWPGVDVPRILPDGSILVEAERKNLVTQSADASAWARTGTGTETAGQGAPDGSTDAYRVADTDAGAITTYTQVVSGALGTGLHAYSVNVLKDSDTSRFPEFEIFSGGAAVFAGGVPSVHLNTSTGATALRQGSPESITVFDAGLWWRLVIVIDVTTGGTVGTRVRPAAASTLGGGLVLAATGAVTAWGIKLEVGAFASSDIRTAGVAETRKVDKASFADGSILDSGRWSVVAVMNHSFVDLASGQLKVLFGRGGLISSALYVRNQGGIPRVVFAADGVIQVSAAVGAWTKVTTRPLFTVDWDTRELTIAGFPSGNGIFAFGSTENWSDLASTELFTGAQNVAGANTFDGVVERPRRA